MNHFGRCPRIHDTRRAGATRTRRATGTDRDTERRSGLSDPRTRRSMGPKTPSQPTSSVDPMAPRRGPGAWVAPQLLGVLRSPWAWVKLRPMPVVRPPISMPPRRHARTSVQVRRPGVRQLRGVRRSRDRCRPVRCRHLRASRPSWSTARPSRRTSSSRPISPGRAGPSRRRATTWSASSASRSLAGWSGLRLARGASARRRVGAARRHPRHTGSRSPRRPRRCARGAARSPRR